jgi:hypothetical protein
MGSPHYPYILASYKCGSSHDLFLRFNYFLESLIELKKHFTYDYWFIVEGTTQEHVNRTDAKDKV